MNINFLAVLTPPQAIYHGCYTQKTFWEEKFTLVNMTSYGRRSVRKHREINNGDQYIILDISSKLDCMYKREVGLSGTGTTTSMYISTKSSNKKQKTRLYITDITKQDFRKLLKKFKNSPYIVYKIKQVYNEPAEAYFFLIKNITKIMKIERHIRLF